MRVAMILILAALTALFAVELPELVRYLKMTRM